MGAVAGGVTGILVGVIFGFLPGIYVGALVGALDGLVCGLITLHFYAGVWQITRQYRIIITATCVVLTPVFIFIGFQTLNNGDLLSNGGVIWAMVASVLGVLFALPISQKLIDQYCKIIR